MDILNEEFLMFLSCAQQCKLKYMLIGGYAVNYYGYSRNTKDMDVWIAPTKENQEAFIQLLLCMQYSEEEVKSLYKEDFTKHFVATIGPPNASIDFLTYVHHTIDFDTAYQQKQIFELSNDIKINIVPYEYLKEMKLRAHRDKDYYDIARLEEIQKRTKK